MDSGATGSFIKLDYALKNKFKIWNNNQKAGLADSKTRVDSVGYVEETFYRDNWKVVFKGLVVNDLNADMYGGQPFIKDNDIIQRPAKQTITVHGKYTVMETNSTIASTINNSASLVTLNKINIDKKVVLPGQSIKIPVPHSISSEKIAIEPRIENKVDSWPRPQIVKIQDGHAQIKNETADPVIIPKDVKLVSMTECLETKPENRTSSTLQCAATIPVSPRTNHLDTVNKSINT